MTKEIKNQRLDEVKDYINEELNNPFSCEVKVKEIRGCKSRCIVEDEPIDNKCVCCGKEAKHHVIWGIQY